MTFRTKLFAVFLLALLLAVGLLAFGVTALTRRTFDQLNHQHIDAAVAQYSREFERREAEVSHQVQEIANAEGTVRMAIDLSRPSIRRFDLCERCSRGGAIASARFPRFLSAAMGRLSRRRSGPRVLVTKLSLGHSTG